MPLTARLPAAPPPVAAIRPGSMRILLATHFFFPNIGGLETVARVLADQFTAQGHEVVVVTQSPRPGGEPLDREEFATGSCGVPARGSCCGGCVGARSTSRTTSACARCGHCCWCIGRGCRFAPHVADPSSTGVSGWQDLPEETAPAAVRQAHCGQPRGGRAPLEVPGIVVIGNPYQDDTLFRLAAGGRAHASDLVFLARLVSDKGGDLLLDAHGRAQAAGRSNPEPDDHRRRPGRRQPLRRHWRKHLGVAGSDRRSYGHFDGRRRSSASLNEHRVMVVPSRIGRSPSAWWPLEGIACGCVPRRLCRAGRPAGRHRAVRADFSPTTMR